MSLLVEQPALIMTVQDQGRSGFQRFGMPESGPMDWWAHRAANRLVGNLPGEACLELGFSSVQLQLESDTLLAAAGTGYHLTINGQSLPLWMSFLGRRGDRIILEKVSGGNWVYLAAVGGLQTPCWMASRSTYVRAGLGRPLAVGDRLPLAAPPIGFTGLAGNSLPDKSQPDYIQSKDAILRVVSGPHQDRFEPESLTVFTEATYQVSPRSDRMGYRLVGPALAHSNGADLISQGMALGEMQVPGDGQPIVMMPDHPTTGGYTCIGTVIHHDLPLLAQAEPNAARLRFDWVDVEMAQDLYRQAIEKIDNGIISEEDPWLQL
jgi:antagonist of KipI